MTSIMIVLPVANVVKQGLEDALGVRVGPVEAEPCYHRHDEEEEGDDFDDNNDDDDDDDEVACHAGHLGLQRPHTIGPHGEPPGIAAGDDNNDDQDDDDQGDEDHDDNNEVNKKSTALPWSVAAGGRDANPNHFL